MKISTALFLLLLLPPFALPAKTPVDSTPQTVASATGAHPNILFIAVDDLNDWVGYLRSNPQTRTPNFDRLAARGEQFARNYSPSPCCNPARAAIMSGLRPGESGVYENHNDWRKVLPPDMMLPMAFRRGGYYVAGAGKIYHERYERPGDWDDYFEMVPLPHPPSRIDGEKPFLVGELDGGDAAEPDYQTTDYVINQLKRKHDKPFFLGCGFHKPHLPLYVPRRFFDMFPLDKIQLPPILPHDLADVPPAGVRFARPEWNDWIRDHGMTRRMIQGYLATIAYMDMNLGRLLDALDASPYRDNTIIVLWSDHGWSLGQKEHWQKFALWEEPTRAPLIWVVPGLTHPGTVCTHAVDMMSIYPTLLDLAGLPCPKHVTAPSLRPLLADPNAAWNHPALSTYDGNNHAVRTEDWRYIRYADGGEELYDERNDPHEWTNLAADPQYARLKAELRACLPKHMAPDMGGTLLPGELAPTF
jgi:arylsulfatase A-like enzyme